MASATVTKVASQRLSDPLRVVELGGPTDDNFDAWAHE